LTVKPSEGGLKGPLRALLCKNFKWFSVLRHHAKKATYNQCISRRRLRRYLKRTWTKFEVPLFFFLEFGRCRAKTRSLHEHKLSKDVCTRTQLVHMSRQIEVKKPNNTQDHQTTTTRKSSSQTCVSPEEIAKQTTTNQTHKKRAGAQTKHPKSICQGTQWLDHCISLQNMRQK